MGKMNPGFLSAEPALAPPDHPDETLAMEGFVKYFLAGCCVEDTEAALQWHGEAHGNGLLETTLAIWHAIPLANTDALEQRSQALRAAVDEIVKTYAEEILWPEHQEKLRKGLL